MLSTIQNFVLLFIYLGSVCNMKAHLTSVNLWRTRPCSSLISVWLTTSWVVTSGNRANVQLTRTGCCRWDRLYERTPAQTVASHYAYSQLDVAFSGGPVYIAYDSYGQVRQPFAMLFNDVFASCADWVQAFIASSLLDLRLRSHLCTIHFIP